MSVRTVTRRADRVEVEDRLLIKDRPARVVHIDTRIDLGPCGHTPGPWVDGQPTTIPYYWVGIVTEWEDSPGGPRSTLYYEGNRWLGLRDSN